MTTISRKQAIETKYLDLCQKVGIIDETLIKLFPSLEECDIVDLVFFFRTLFPVGCDYRREMKKLASVYGITTTEDKMELITPLVIEYLQWFRTLM